MKRVGLCIFVLLLLILPAQAQGREPAEQQLIRLQTATFDPLTDGEPIAAIGSQALEATGPYYIVQFKGPVEQAWVQQLEHLGAELLGYIPDNAHVARIQPADVAKVQQMYAVRWLGPYRPSYKLAPALASQARLADAVVDVYVAGFPGESLDALRAFLTGLGATIEDAAETEIGITFRIQVASSALTQIAQHPAISWVEPYAPLKMDNSEGRKIMGVEQVWQNSGLFGAGQVVAISDSGLSVQGALSPDFGPVGRLRRAFAPSEMNLSSDQCRQKTNWTDLNGHGTHVSGSVLGNGTASGSNPAAHQYAGSQAGAAPEAQLVFMALNTDGSLGIQCISTNGDFIAKGYEQGARISSNSWGGGPDGSYGILSSIVDNYIWNHKDYTVLYSAGNSGQNGPRTIGSPGTAKNVITVGASENNRPNLGPISDNPASIASFSSRGPTADGRAKPDIVAPGTRVLSVLAAQASALQPVAPGVPYAFSDGTSMATPLAAGATTLAREWLGKLRGMPNPSAAFLKALMLHGAFRLPGAAAPDTNSGWGRLDLKNTLSAQYAVFDDHVQGLSSGQAVQYSVQVAGSNNAGTLFVADPDHPNTTDTIQLSATPSLAQTTVAPRPAGWRVEPAPGYDRAANPAPLGTTTGKKDDLAPVTGRASPAQRPAPAADANGPVINSTLVNMIAGGNFENPNLWNIWRIYGRPLITNGNDGGLVLNGQYSLWLGGSPTEDSVWYPLSFPDTIDTSHESSLSFKLQMTNLDGEFDSFCFGFINESGYFMNDFGGCYNQAHLPPASSLSFPLSSAQKASLAGKSGYLVLYNLSDHLAPHMSAYVDDVVLTIDFDDVTLESIPSSGPAGTTFLLAGSNYVPYTHVDICIPSCDSQDDIIGGAYSDARGDLLAYLYTTSDTNPGSYTVETSDVADRTASTDVDITGHSQPKLSVSPASGQAGTTFRITGSDFVPNDSKIEVWINGRSQGRFGSAADGGLTFTVNTWSNTPPGTYTVQATDSAGSSATVNFVVTAVPGGNPTMTVAPAAGPPGSSFTFNGSGFAPSATIDFSLDGQALGQATADTAGAFKVTLNTNPNIPPATYTLAARQGAKQASAQFAITGGGGSPAPGGNGIYVTLAWTDPPAQANAAATLINNLDLRVVGPDGRTYLGNGGGAPDVKNNVEGVRIERPAPGRYTIFVEARSVDAAFGAQPYALIATTAQSFGANATNVGLGRRLYLPIGRR